MADKFLNLTAVQTIKTWAKNLFAKNADLTTLSNRVDEIIEEGGEPNVIETVKVNSVALTPDTQKAVNIPVPDIKLSGSTFKIGQTNGGNDDTDSLTITPDYNDSTPKSVWFGGGDGFDHQVPTVQYMQSYVEENGGKIDKFKVNGTEQTITDKTVDIAVPTKTSDLTNDGNGTTGSKFATTDEVDTKIESAIVGALKPKGSIAFADLPALTASNLNNIYEITESFTTTADFTEGAGHTYPVGTEVAIINAGTDANPVYKYSTYGGYYDQSSYWTSEPNKVNTLEAATVTEINNILNS